MGSGVRWKREKKRGMKRKKGQEGGRRGYLYVGSRRKKALVLVIKREGEGERDSSGLGVKPNRDEGECKGLPKRV